MRIRSPVRMCQPVSESRNSLRPPLNTKRQKASVSTAINVAMSGNAKGAEIALSAAEAVLGSAGANARQACRDAGIQADDGGGKLIDGSDQSEPYGGDDQRVFDQGLPLLVMSEPKCQPNCRPNEKFLHEIPLPTTTSAQSPAAPQSRRRRPQIYQSYS